MFFVIEIDEKGIPGALRPCRDFNDAKDLCVEIAKENGVPEAVIKGDIVDDDTQPGTFYGDNTSGAGASGVWVVASED